MTLSRGIIQVRDLDSDSAYGESSRDIMRRFGSRSLLGVPLLRDGRVFGSIVLGHKETGGFDAAEVALVEAFAEQAVIAIASATALGELRARTAELARRNSEYGERIEQQTATIDVLKVMSASPGDARPVFELIVDRARRFCEAERAMVALVDGDMLHLQAHTGMTGDIARSYEAQFPRPVAADEHVRPGHARPRRRTDPGCAGGPAAFRKSENRRFMGSLDHCGAAAARGRAGRRDRDRAKQRQARPPRLRWTC